MSRVRRVENAAGEHVGWRFHCPGCDEAHVVGLSWSFNGNLERPTFSPSLLVRTGHFVSGFAQGDDCWCTWGAENPGEPMPFACVVCHSFVVDGRIRYLTDSTHALAGQTVELPEVA